MRILQINVTANSGSTGRIAENIGKVFIEKGHESQIAYGRSANKSVSKLIKIGNKLDVYEHVLHSRIFDRHGFSSKNATYNFIEQIKRIKPDVIGLHNLHGYYLNIEILFNYLKAVDIPVIWTLHDCWAFTGHCIHFDYVRCEKWKTHCKNCPQTHMYPKSILLDNSFKNFKEKKKIFTGLLNLSIVTPSKWLKDLVHKSLLREYSTHVIYNGVDIEQFKIQSEKKGCLADKKVVLGVANVWEERKGFDDFIELSKILYSNYQIVLIGLTNRQKKQLPNNINGIERTENIDELIKWYNKADVFVNTTKEETLGMVNIEAIACGTPVVTYNTGGSVETISKETGIVVEKGNIVELKEAIINIVNTTTNFTHNQCRQRALNNFDKDDRFKDYYDLYISKSGI